MKLRVLTVLPSQEPLMESAMALAESRSPEIRLSSADTPTGFEIDESFSAVAMGSLEDGFISMDSLHPTTSKDFAVRGTVDVQSVDEVPIEIDGRLIFADPEIAEFAYCGSAAQGTVADVQTMLDVPALASKGLDGNNVAIAIMDTGINSAHLSAQLGATPRLDVSNSWRLPGSAVLPGNHPVGHGTMCAFDSLIAAPAATLLDYPILRGNAAGANITGKTISVAFQAYSHLLANYAVAFAPGGASHYNGLVVNNSWGIYNPSWDFPPRHPGRYIDNPNHPFSAIVTALVNAGVDVLFAAGNCGVDCPSSKCNGRTTETIMGANAYDNVMTLAACLATNDDRLGYSSQGPSISGMPQQKPNLTAYSHFIGSESYGVGSPDSGTSAACPVAAGCVAAIRTNLTAASCPPQNLIAQFEANARTASGVNPGWNVDYGHGIIDPVATANSLGL